MISSWFISHQWKQARRSPFWQKSVALNIILGFVVVLLLLELLLLGLAMRTLLSGAFPEGDLLGIFNGALLYYFAIDLILRYLMQGLPVIAAQPYFHLPVRKSSIVNYMLAKSKMFILNYLPLLVFIPWAINTVSVEYSTTQALQWLFGIIFLIFTNNFIIIYVKRQIFSRPWIVAVFGLSVIGFILLDYLNVYSIAELSKYLFLQLIMVPWAWLVPLALMISAYAINFFYLRARMYVEEISIRKQRKTDSLAGINYVKSLGKVGELVAFELKLYLRNKRPKSLMYLFPIFLLYGLFFYPQGQFMEMGGMLVFIGIFITGGIGMSIGNYFLGWESSFFDAILSNNIDFEKYFKAKYMILLGAAVFSYVVTLPYGFFSLEILYINSMCFLLNIGVSAYVILFFCSNNRKRMDLSRGAAFNYQGVGVSQFIIMLPLLLFPVIIFSLLKLVMDPTAAITVLGILGLAGLLFHKPLMNAAVKRFMQRRHRIADGFREK